MKEKKKTHGIQLLIRCVVRDPDGKVISDTGNKPANSFVIQFLEFLRTMFVAPIGQTAATAVDGTEDNIYDYLQNANLHFRVDSGINVSSYGLVVGTGDTAEDNEDYKLETQLTNGVGPGNITHASVVIGAVAVVGANVDLEIKRAFTNLTGSSIGVKEAGIYAKYSATAPGQPHCIIRDVLPGTVDVPDMCSLTIIYTLRTTV